MIGVIASHAGGAGIAQVGRVSTQVLIMPPPIVQVARVSTQVLILP